MTITTKMQLPATRKAIAGVVLVLAALLMVNGAALMLQGLSPVSTDEGEVLAVAESGLRPSQPVAVSEPVGAGRSIAGADGWLTYTDSAQQWQVDVPARFQEIDVGDDAKGLAAIHDNSTYSLEWTPAGGELDLHLVAERVTDFVQSDLGFNYRAEIIERDATFEPVVVGNLDAVRYSVEVGVGTDLVRHSGVVFQIGGELVSAGVLDFGGVAPLEADRYLSSLRTLS
ncbi:MAG: hypothetical protein ACR2OH_02805 [Microthrixaceae bacterium]